MKQKKSSGYFRISLVLLVSSLVLVPLCGRDDLVEYRNVEKGFSISFPKNWEKKEGFLGSTVIALEPVEEGDGSFRSNVSVVTETVSPGVKAGDYYKLQFKSLNNLASQIRDFKLHSNRPADVGGINGKELVYSYTVGQLRVTVMSRVAIKDTTGYIITGTTKNSGEFSKRYRKIAKSFHFL